jgi:hypothetical protein
MHRRILDMPSSRRFKAPEVVSEQLIAEEVFVKPVWAAEAGGGVKWKWGDVNKSVTRVPLFEGPWTTYRHCITNIAEYTDNMMK